MPPPGELTNYICDHVMVADTAQSQQHGATVLTSAVHRLFNERPGKLTVWFHLEIHSTLADGDGGKGDGQRKKEKKS